MKQQQQQAREKILVIGDGGGELRPVVEQAAPAAEITLVPTVFDGLAELVANRYSAVLASAEPIERRPEAAVRQLRELAGDSRLLVFGNPTLEPLSKKMLSFGVDDYVVTPATVEEVGKVLAAPVKKIPEVGKEEAPHVHAGLQVEGEFTGLGAVPLADVVLDALVQHPGDAAGAAVRALNKVVGPAGFQVAFAAAGGAGPVAPVGAVRVSQPVKSNEGEEVGEVYLFLPPGEGQESAVRFVAQLASLLGKVTTLQQRHAGLQRLAITDDLTGLYNGRYFRHFLTRILELAKRKMFPVTLFTFDIDNFKQYNDQFGHCCGDEILKQTATLIKRCVREHDHVARIGGDEFAVVFWEKDAPRQPHNEGAMMGTPGKPPTDPWPILQRFRGMLASQDLTLLGAHGKGSLTISGGLAVYPWQASDVNGLIKAADEQLMFGAKKKGKNTIHLVGRDEDER